MTGELRRKSWNNQAGRITIFGFMILIMSIITIYELSVIYADWNRIKMIPLQIAILSDARLPIPGVGVTINKDYIGQTDNNGKLTALISEAGKINVKVMKKPLADIDTTIFLEDTGTNVVFSMNRPYATLRIVTLNESGEPLGNVGISVDNKNRGQTGEDGSLEIAETVHVLDSIDVRLSKSGFNDLSKQIYLADAAQSESFTMTKKTASSPGISPAPAPSPAISPAPPSSTPDFQTSYNLASRYLDRAISGQPKYFGQALNEIDKAISIRPKQLQAKQLKVEILYNFAKSLRDSGLPREAANRLGEALKLYGEIPRDPLYNEVQKLKAEVDKKK